MQKLQNRDCLSFSIYHPGLKISVGHGHYPFVKLSDMARKPSDILSDPSGIEVNSLSDRTIALSEVNVQRFYHHSVPVARKIFPRS